LDRLAKYGVVNPLIEGLQCLHRHDVAHRDIKLANVMYDSRQQSVKWIDLGLSCVDDQSQTSSLKGCGRSIVGTMSTMAPEVMLMKIMPATQQVLEVLQSLHTWIRADIWSFGCMINEIVTGAYAPFQEEMARALNEPRRLMKSAKEDDLATLFKHITPLQYKTFPNLVESMRDCMKISPSERMLSLVAF
jgi:serine/threonine protein kinase